MAKQRLGHRKLLSVALGEREAAMLDYMAGQEDRYLGEMIRIAIREAAKARGLTPEMFEQPKVAQEA